MIKQLFTIGLLAILAACGSQKQPDTKNDHATDSTSQKTAAETTVPKTDTAQVSNEPVTGNYNSDRLKQLAAKNVFSTLHSKLIPTLPESLQEVFKNSPDLVLLTYSKGNLFLNDKEDYAFVVYGKSAASVGIMVYDAMANTFSQLYSDIKVENELGSLDCNSARDELNLDIENNLIDQSDYLVKDPAKYLGSPAIKIADISKDKDIMIKDGCLSKRTTKTDLKSALCVSTSTVYNNWACLRYDKTKNIFVIFYSQAYSD